MPNTTESRKVRREDMKSNQKYSPKYWMGHYKQNDDVMLFSASKNREECCKLMEEAYGEDWFLDEDFDVILVEINQVLK